MRNEKACVSDPNKFVTCSGSTVRIEYSAKVKPDGSIELVPSELRPAFLSGRPKKG